MKLQKQVAYNIKGKDYYKYVINIPPNRIEKLGWKEGIELIEELKGNSLLIKSLKKEDIKRTPEEVLYQQFKNSVKNLLERYPINGLNWTEIRDKLNYPQVVPNNKWVRNLEKDIGLIRIKRGKEMIWRLENDTIYTIGYEGLKIEDFVKKLKSANIQQLIDVREIPLSRKNGFSKTILQQKLRDASIFYKHYPELGSPKRIRHQLHTDLNYELFFREYKEVVKDDSKMKKTFLLCFERDYKPCHRSIIAEELVNQGWKVNHL